MIDHDNLEEFRDPQTYDLQDEGYYMLCGKMRFAHFST